MNPNKPATATVLGTVTVLTVIGFSRAANPGVEGGNTGVTDAAQPASGSVPAGSPAQPAPKPTIQLPPIYDTLGLTPAQRTQIQAIYADTALQEKTVNATAGLSFKEKISRLRDLVIARRTKINAVLTPAQQTKMLQTRRQETADRAPASRLQMLDANLTLTPDQKEKILPILQQEVKDTEALRGDKRILTPAEGENLKAIHDTAMTNIRALLTPDQVEKLAQVIARSQAHSLAPMSTRPIPSSH